MPIGHRQLSLGASFDDLDSVEPVGCSTTIARRLTKAHFHHSFFFRLSRPAITHPTTKAIPVAGGHKHYFFRHDILLLFMSVRP